MFYIGTPELTPVILFLLQVLELLNAFCGKSLTRRKLVTLLLKQIADCDEETQMQDDQISLSPMQATVHWISKIQTLSTSVSHANIQAMNFAREIVNVRFHLLYSPFQHLN